MTTAPGTPEEEAPAQVARAAQATQAALEIRREGRLEAPTATTRVARVRPPAMAAELRSGLRVQTRAPAQAVTSAVLVVAKAEPREQLLRSMTRKY